MECDNCREERDPVFVLRAQPGEADRPTLDLRFCSFECLQTWT